MAVAARVLEAAGFSRPGRLARVREWWEREHVFGYALIVPALALIVGLVAYPFGMAIYFSLSDYWVGSPGGFVGLQNFRDILGNEIFRQTVVNSFVVVSSVMAAPASLRVLTVSVEPVRVPESVIAPPPVSVTVLVLWAVATSKPVASR